MSAFDIIEILFLLTLLGSCAFLLISLGWWMFENSRLGEIFLDGIEEKLRRKEE